MKPKKTRKPRTQSYRVRWEIDIQAENPQQAAEVALKILRDKESTGAVFDVIEPKGTIATICAEV